MEGLREERVGGGVYDRAGVVTLGLKMGFPAYENCGEVVGGG